MLRYPILILAVLFLSACSQFIPQIKEQITPKDQRAFSQAVDSFRSTHRVGLLKDFQEEYPESEWAPRADTLIRYALEVEQRKVQIEKSSQQIKQQAVQLDTLKQKNQKLLDDIDELTQLNQQLTEQITQLKGLLIQLEQRPQ